MKVTYQEKEVVVRTYNVEIDDEEFKEYIKEVRFFCEVNTPPKAVMLMKDAGDCFVTECATIPASMVGDTKATDLKDWFDIHYKEVYNYLKDNNITLY